MFQKGFLLPIFTTKTPIEHIKRKIDYYITNFMTTFASQKE